MSTNDARDSDGGLRVNVYKNGELVEENVEKSPELVEKLDGFTQYNPDANGGDGDFEKFRVEEVEA